MQILHPAGATSDDVSVVRRFEVSADSQDRHTQRPVGGSAHAYAGYLYNTMFFIATVVRRLVCYKCGVQ